MTGVDGSSLLVRGGLVADGTGAPLAERDVAVAGGRIRLLPPGSMVAAAVPHDPEDSAVPEVPVASGLWVANKTGTDVGTRCDVGVVRGARQVGYAVLTQCPAGREFEMVQGMREIGTVVGRVAASGDS